MAETKRFEMRMRVDHLEWLEKESVRTTQTISSIIRRLIQDQLNKGIEKNGKN